MRPRYGRLAVALASALACSEPSSANSPAFDTGTNTLHEPADYAQILGWNASTFPATVSSGGSHAPAAGLTIGYGDNQKNNTNNALIVSPAGIPVGTTALQTTWPIGINGQGPVNFSFWSNPKTTQYSKVYLRWWQYLVPDSTDGKWESGFPLTKWGFVGYGQAASTGVNQGFFGIGQGGGSTTHIDSLFRPEFHQQNIVSRDFAGLLGAVKVGRWELWEANLEINAIGSSNGKLQLWITPQGGSATQIFNAANVVYRTSADPNKFTRYSWNPTFGGAGAATRNSRAYATDLYISGVP